MVNPVSFLYEVLLKRGIVQSSIPVNHILLVLDETDLIADKQGMDKLRQFIQWCHELDIENISVYVSIVHDGMESVLVENVCSHLGKELRKALNKENAAVAIYNDKTEQGPLYADVVEGAGIPGRNITVSLGFSGKSELTWAIKEIVKKVKAGEVAPEEIDEKLIESELLFKSEPDLVIRSGATRLVDFLIWQSVYTEFYFTDMNWVNFRKIDLLRALRDFQMRERRFGR